MILHRVIAGSWKIAAQYTAFETQTMAEEVSGFTYDTLGYNLKTDGRRVVVERARGDAVGGNHTWAEYKIQGQRYAWRDADGDGPHVDRRVQSPD
ncbi:hypothetical protein E4U43_000947 [Claviceps pusilla]|uniref:Uncharacterized protein n=1 Tax=Claviceps pusilla TaxID=123648 RepID=A0A9P7N8J8_9HYPO|nr:hypothetical protein E4U43_000947 [Claviceps pusilla]